MKVIGKMYRNGFVSGPDNKVTHHSVELTEKDLYLLNSMLIRHEKTCLSIEKDHIEEIKHMINQMISDY